MSPRAGPAAELRRALAAQALDRAVLRAGGDAQRLLPCSVGTSTSAPRIASGIVSGTSTSTLSPLRLNTGLSCTWVTTNRSPDGPPLRPGLALAGEPDARALAHAGGDVHAVALRRAHGALAVAGRARVLDHVPAPWQRVHGWEIENRPWPCDSTPRPWQRGQTFGSVPGFAPVPWQVAQRAGAATLSGTWAPSIACVERDVDLGLEVGAALGARRAGVRRRPSRRRRRGCDRMSPKPPVRSRRSRPRRRPHRRRRPAAGAEEDPAAVVLLALVRVADDVVGRLDLLEALLGLRVVRVAVRVVLARELAVGLLDLVGRRLAVDAEDGSMGLAGPSVPSYAATTTLAGRSTSSR